MRSRWLWRLLLGAAGLLVQSAGSVAADHALLIGIDRYPKVPALVGSKNDVDNMRRFAQTTLGFRPEDTKILVDEQATRQGILAALDDWLVKGTRPGDRVLFYYSGHGAQTPDQNGDEEDGLDEALVSYDTYLNHGAYQNLVIDDELEAIFKQLDDRRVMILIDSCHSGTATRAFTAMPCEAQPYQKTLRQCGTRSAPVSAATLRAHRQEESLVPSTTNRIVWSAASSAQIAFVNQETSPPVGVFTHYFIQGMERGAADRNHNGTVTNAELLDYVRQESERYCQRHRDQCTLGLTPALEAPSAALKQPAKAPHPATTITLSDSGSTAMPASVPSATPASTPQPASPVVPHMPPHTPPPAVATVPSSPAVSPPPSPAAEAVTPVPPSPPPSTPNATPPPSAAASTTAVATDILAHGNDGQVQVELLPSPRVRVGVTVKMRVTSPRDGYLVLLAIDAAGQLRQVFPNTYSMRAGKENRVLAQRPVVIPDTYYGFDFKATPPPGQGTLLAVVSEDHVDTQEVLAAHQHLQTISQSTEYLTTLASRLYRTWRQDTVNRPARWSLGRLEYTIDP